jgi:L-lactate dehydrogenase complex protein LldE
VHISLFIACYNDVLFPQTGKAVVAVLERLGHTVEFRREQTCCGQMHYNSGYGADAAQLMRQFVRVYRGADVICVPSASCVAMMRDHYPKMAAATSDRALAAEVRQVLPRVYEFTELLVDKLGVTDVGASFAGTVTLHTSCHSIRSLHLGDRPARLLRAVRGLQLVDLPQSQECCGFGGTFAVKNAEVSTAMAADKARCVMETKAAVCTGADNSCLMQIGGLLSRMESGVRCLHIAEILGSDLYFSKPPGSDLESSTGTARSARSIDESRSDPGGKR